MHPEIGLTPLSLATATVQDIHLELIRRSEHNAFHGARVLADLLAHRQDWQAVLFDTYGLATDRGLPARLLKLRDMAANDYNADTLHPGGRCRSGAATRRPGGGVNPTSTVRKTPSARWERAAPTSAWSRCGGIEALHRPP